MSDLQSDMAKEKERWRRDKQRLQDLVSELRLKSQAEVDSFRSEMARMTEDADVKLNDAKQDALSAMREKADLADVGHCLRDLTNSLGT